MTTLRLDQKLRILDGHYNIGKYSKEDYHYQKNELLHDYTDTRYFINTEEDIINLISSLESEINHKYIYPVMYVYDPKRMIQLGLWPTSVDIDNLMIDWLSGSDPNSMRFWHLSECTRDPEFLKNETVWSYKPVKIIKQEALDEADSTRLMFVAPELVYQKSRRPKTDMSLFRNSSNLRISKNEIIRGKININGETWNVVPVTRYAKGMSRGLYYNNPADDICGTFFYLEEESTTFLTYKRALRAFNKTDAMKKLQILDLSSHETMNIVIETEKHINGYYPRNLILTPSEAFCMNQERHGYSQEIHDYQDGNEIEPNNIPEVPRYAGIYLSLYAKEDKFDQPLCKGARAAGYDIVILENMVGSFQVVTEVLDTRPREESFKNLLYVID